MGNRLCRIDKDIALLSRATEFTLLVDSNVAASVDNVVLIDKHHVLQADAQLSGETRLLVVRNNAPRTLPSRNSHWQWRPHL